MATVAELLVKIGADSQGLRKEIAASRRQMQRAFGPDALQFADKAGTALLGLSAGIGAVGFASIKMAADMEQNRIAFTTMLGSAEQADKFLRELAAFAEKTPFEFTGLVASSKKLLAFGFQAKEIIPIMTKIGDAVSAVGGSAEVLDRVTLAFGQMKTKGFVSAEEMKQLAEAGIPAWEMLAKVIGKDLPTTMKLAEDKALDANAAIEGMLSQMTEKYGGMMEKQSKTITGMLSNIKDKSGSIMRDMGEEITKAVDLKSKMQGSLDFLDEFASRVKSSGATQALIDMVPAPVITAAIFTVSTALTATLIPAILSARIAALSLWASLGPLGWAVVGVSTLVGTLAVQSQKSNSASELMNATIYDGSVRLMDYAKSANTATTALDRFSGAGAEGGLSRIGDEVKWFDEFNAAAEKSKKALASSVIIGDKAAEQAMKDLKDEAERVHKDIKREWVQTTQTELQQLNIWEKEQLDSLEKTKSMNADYEQDKIKVTETASVRRRKILADEARATAAIWDKATEDARAMQTKVAQLKLPTVTNADGGQETSKVALQKLNIQTDFEAQISNIRNKYRDWAAEYSTSTDQQKEQSRLAWTESGKQFEITTDGMVNFKRQIDAEIVIAEQEKTAKLKTINEAYLNWKEQLESAYNEGSLTKFKEQLNTEQALYQQSLTTKQSIIDSYYEAWKIAHKSAQDYMLEGINTMSDGLERFFSDALSGTETWSDAWRNLKKTAGDMIASMAAEWIAARIKMWLIDKLFGSKSENETQSKAAASSAAWWPAAIARSLAEAGANAPPAIAGMAAASVAGMALQNVSGHATGGYITGPGTGTSDSILSRLSHGEYVIKAKAVRKIGLDALNMINRGILPGFASGGIVTGPSIETYGAGRYANTTIGGSSFEAVNTTSTSSQPPVFIQPIIKAWDMVSIDRWLEDGGGRKLEKYFTKRAREFAPVGG